MANEGRRVYLFAPKEDPENRLSAAAKSYIAHGKSRGVDAAYKCRVRSPWWQVPGLRRPDLFLTYMNQDTPRLVANDANVAYLNSVHGVTLRAEHRTRKRGVGGRCAQHCHAARRGAGWTVLRLLGAPVASPCGGQVASATSRVRRASSQAWMTNSTPPPAA
jgi:hypothetical protein